MTQSQQIKELRRLLNPHRVLVGRLPKWATEIEFPARSWVDHAGIGRGEFACCAAIGACYISEPYEFGKEDAEDINAFCDRHGLDWHVSANSWHYPGHTIRIIIHPYLDLSATMPKE